MTSRLAPARWLRFLLLWPLISTYRERSRRSLRWRLTGSHLLAVLMVPAVLFALLALLAIGLAIFSWIKGDIFKYEAAIAARTVAQRVTDDGPGSSISQREARSVSYVDRDGVIRVSSDPDLVGRTADAIGPGAAEVLQSALSGSRSLAANNRERGDIDGTIGSYPIRTPAGAIEGAIIVDSPPYTFRTAVERVAKEAVQFILAALGVGAVYLVPGLAAASLIGIRRARDLARPMAELSDAAQALARGELDQRVSIDGEDEVAELGRSFNSMAERLQSVIAQETAERARAEGLLAANRELVANISHELRTPVALIRGHLEALAGESKDPSAYVGIALRESARLESLVDDLFDLTRIESGALTAGRAAFDAAAAVREAVESLVEPARREARVLVQADLPSGTIECAGDRARLVQVLQNLIRNAIRFTPEGGIVLVGARQANDWVEITVRDTGGGISPADLPHIFERLYRGDRSRSRSTGGAGLGLAIARELVEAMGGAISAISPPGEGATFTINLPLTHTE